jgi:hypothetical protein
MGATVLIAAQDTAGHRILNVLLMSLGLVAAILAIWGVGRAGLWIEKNGTAVGRIMIAAGLIAATEAYIAGSGGIIIVCGAATMIIGTCVWALGL